MPAFKIEPYHRIILPQLDQLDLTHGDSVAVARFAAGLLSTVAVPPEDLPDFIAGVEDLIRRMAENQAPFASRAASVLRDGLYSLQNRLDSRSGANAGLLAAIGHGRSGRRPDAHCGDDDDSDVFASGHGEQGFVMGRGGSRTAVGWLQDDSHRVGLSPVSVGGHRSTLFNRDGASSIGCPFSAGPEAHKNRRGAPDPRTVVVRGLGSSGGGVAGQVFGEH